MQERYRDAIAHLSALPFQTRRSRLYQIAAHMALGEIEQAQKLARAGDEGSNPFGDMQCADLTIDFGLLGEFLRLEAMASGDLDS